MKSYQERCAWIMENIDYDTVRSYVDSTFAMAYVAYTGASHGWGWCKLLSKDLSKLYKLGLLNRVRKERDNDWHYEYTIRPVTAKVSWISVSEHMPPACADLLVVRRVPIFKGSKRTKLISEQYYVSTRPAECVEDDNILYWMEKPQPPEE